MGKNVVQNNKPNKKVVEEVVEEEEVEEQEVLEDEQEEVQQEEILEEQEEEQVVEDQEEEEVVEQEEEVVEEVQDKKRKLKQEDKRVEKKQKFEEAPTEEITRFRIYVGNLSYDIDEESLREAFQSCGEIENVHFVLNADGSFWGTAFIRFDSAAAMYKALDLNGMDILGRPCKVQMPRDSASSAGKPRRNVNGPRTLKSPGCVTVFLGNIADTVEDNDIYELFQDIGTVVDLRWVIDRNTNSFKGCGFVDFAETESTDKAVELTGTNIKGRSIRIDYAPDTKNKSQY